MRRVRRRWWRSGSGRFHDLGFAAVDGDQRVVAEPPGVCEAGNLRHGLEPVQLEVVHGSARQRRSGTSAPTGVIRQGQRLNPPCDAGMQGHPRPGVKPELSVRTDHERIGKSRTLRAGFEEPVRVRPPWYVPAERPRPSVIVRRRRKGQAAPDSLEGGHPIDLALRYPVLHPSSPVLLYISATSPVAMAPNKILSPAGETSRDYLTDDHRSAPTPFFPTLHAASTCWSWFDQPREDRLPP